MDGTGTVILAGDDLLILHERGELIRAAASPEAFKLKARAAILKADVRAYPALAGGLYFARDQERLGRAAIAVGQTGRGFDQGAGLRIHWIDPFLAISYL